MGFNQSAASSTQRAKRLPGQVNSVTLQENLFLPIQRQMVAVFSHHDVRQQSRRGQAAIQQPFRQRRDQRSASRGRTR